MRVILLILAIIFASVANAQSNSTFCLTRNQVEEIYKMTEINKLLETRKSECDTLVISLEEENRILVKKSQISDSIIAIQNRNSLKKDEIIRAKDEQLKNLGSIIEYKDQKIRYQAEENASLKRAIDREKPKKYRWGGMGLVVGAGVVLLFIL